MNKNFLGRSKYEIQSLPLLKMRELKAKMIAKWQGCTGMCSKFQRNIHQELNFFKR